MTDPATTDAAPSRRPVGRPRQDGRPHLTRDAVLQTAARMIARNGYAGASIRALAGALDASPASLFNLFPSKEALLNTLIAYAAAPSLDFYHRLRGLDAPPADLLFKSVHEETLLVASVDQDYPALFYLPELRKPAFAAAQGVRAELVGHYRGLIEAGCEDGVLSCDARDLAAEQLLQLTETRLLAGPAAAARSPADQARATARLCLRALLVRPQDLDAIEARAARIDARIVLPDLAP